MDRPAGQFEAFRVSLRAMTDSGTLAEAQRLVAPSGAWEATFERAGVAEAAVRAQFFRAALLGGLTTLVTSRAAPPADVLADQLLQLLPGHEAPASVRTEPLNEA